MLKRRWDENAFLWKALFISPLPKTGSTSCPIKWQNRTWDKEAKKIISETKESGTNIAENNDNNHHKMNREISEEEKMFVCSLLPQHPPAPEPASNRNGARIRSGRFYHPFRSVRPPFSQKNLFEGEKWSFLCVRHKIKPDFTHRDQTSVEQG